MTVDRPLVVSVPASSANLGAGFDALGMALTIRAEVGTGQPPPGAHAADESHPAMVAFRRVGGVGPLWVRSSIPMARGLGYSAAVRAGGAVAGIGARRTPGDGEAGPIEGEELSEALEIVADLEGHADNAAASLAGGVTVAAGGRVVRVPMALDPAIVLWIPGSTTTTNRSRSALPTSVAFDDATFNVGRAALMVAALATGDASALRAATADRLHQDQRLARVDGAADALRAALDGGAWCSWLSGSGPTVAAMCHRDDEHDVCAALERWSSAAGYDARVRAVGVDPDGVRLTVG